MGVIVGILQAVKHTRDSDKKRLRLEAKLSILKLK